jgi:hypothetical protein
MPSRARLLCFALLFFPLLTLLAWPFSLVGRGYRSLICGAANRLVLSSAHHPYVGRLVPSPRPDQPWHVVAAVWNLTTKSVEAQFDADVHQTFYLPTACFCALTLAGSCTWKGKRVVLKLLIGIAFFQLRGTLQFVDLDRSIVDAAHANVSDVILVVVNRSLVTPLGMAFALPLLLWFGLFRSSLFRSQDALGHRDTLGV